MSTFLVRLAGLWSLGLAIYGVWWGGWSAPDIGTLSALPTVLLYMRVQK